MNQEYNYASRAEIRSRKQLLRSRALREYRKQFQFGSTLELPKSALPILPTFREARDAAMIWAKLKGKAVISGDPPNAFQSQPPNAHA